MSNEPTDPHPAPILYKGEDVRSLPAETLVEALQDAFAELLDLRARVSDDGRAAAARDEELNSQLRAQRDFLGSAAEYQSRILDAATAYNQLIVIGGYAAFFAVWSAFAKDIGRTMLISAGVLMLVSMIVYVAWTVIGMFLMGVRNMEAISSFNGGLEGFVERIQAVELAGQQRSQALLKYWRWVVFGSGATGLVAAALLGGAAAYQVIPKPGSSQQSRLQLAVQKAEAAAARAERSARAASAFSKTPGRIEAQPGSVTTPRQRSH